MEVWLAIVIVLYAIIGILYVIDFNYYVKSFHKAHIAEIVISSVIVLIFWPFLALYRFYLKAEGRI